MAKRSSSSGVVVEKRKRQKISYDSDSEVLFEALDFVAVLCEQGGEEPFWLARLADDVTSANHSVRITWMQLKKQSDGQYEYSFDDCVDARSLLCGVWLSAELELSKAEEARVLLFVRCAENPQDENVQRMLQDAEEQKRHKQPNTAKPPKPKTAKPKKKTKLKKGQSLLPFYAKVTPVREDVAFSGDHPFCDFEGDSFAASREVIRAAATNNITLLEKFFKEKEFYSKMHSCFAYRSADVRMTWLHYMIKSKDITILKKCDDILKETLNIRNSLSEPPRCLLSSSGTGHHSSSFSCYNRREINSIRGNKEGNNALLSDDDSEYSFSSMKDFLLQEEIYDDMNLEMLNYIYPNDKWLSMGAWALDSLIKSLARFSNVVLLRYIIEILERRDGWGYNKLHVEVLKPSTVSLTKFLKVSVFKKSSCNLRPIHFAALNSEHNHLQALMEEIMPCNVEEWNVEDNDGWKTIHYAAINKSSNCLKYFLEILALDLNIDEINEKGVRNTPLLLSCSRGLVDNVRCILNYSKKKDTVSSTLAVSNKNGQTAIHIAAAKGFSEIVQLLHEFGCDVNSKTKEKVPALSVAAMNGHEDTVSMLLKCGAEVNCPDKFKKTPLIYAMKNGFLNVSACLINSDANLNAEDSSLNSVAHYAAAYGWVDCLQFLIETGAECWSQNIWKITPMAAAALKGRLTCAHLLLQSNAPVSQSGVPAIDFQDINGLTLVSIQCTEADDISELSFYLKKNANPNIVDVNDESPLQKLISRNNSMNHRFIKDAAELLLDHGATLESEALNMDPLFIKVVKNSNIDLTKILATKYNANVNITDSSGKTALMHAISNFSIFKLLITALNADVNVKDNFGNSILNYAFNMTSSSPQAHVELILDCRPDLTLLDAQNQNIFHLLARINPLLNASLIERFIDLHPDPVVALNRVNDNGFSPILLLATNEITTFSNKNEGWECYENYCKVLEKFAEFTVEIETLKLQKKKGKNDAGTSEDCRSIEGENIFHFLMKTRLNSNSCTYMSSRNSIQNGRNLLQILAPIVERKFGKKLLLDLLNCQNEVSNFSPLYYAVTHDCFENVETLLRFEVDANVTFLQKSNCFTAQNFSSNCLISVVRQNNLRLMNLLIRYGADPSIISLPGEESLLHIAMRNQFKDVVKVLLAIITSFNVKDCKKQTPLVSAIQFGLTVDQADPNESVVDYSMIWKSKRVLLREENVEWWWWNAQGKKCRYPQEVEEKIEQMYQRSDRTPIEVKIDDTDYQICTKTMTQRNKFTRGNVRKVKRFGDKTFTSRTESSSNTKDSSILKMFLEKVMLLSPSKQNGIFSAVDVNGRNAVHYAAQKRDLALLRVLIKCSKSDKEIINTRDLYGRTPLHLAVNSSSIQSDSSFEVESFLVKNGADVNMQDKFGFTVLHFALLKVDIDCFNFLPSDTFIEKFFAFTGDWIKFREVLLQLKNNENFQFSQLSIFLNKIEHIPLTETDPIETLSNFCLVPGIEVNHPDVLGRTPLHLAASTGSNVCVLSLLHVGAELEAICANKNTPLGMAMAYRRKLVAVTLLQQKANIHSTFTHVNGDGDGERNSYYFEAVKNSWQGVSHLILNAGFSYRQAMEDSLSNRELKLCANLLVKTFDNSIIQQVNQSSQTLLHILALHFHDFGKHTCNIAWELVHAGVNVNAKDIHGCSAMHYAAINLNFKMCHFLNHHSCEMNTLNNKQENPVLAAMNANNEMSSSDIKVMFEYFDEWIDFDQVDNQGKNLLILCIEKYVDRMAFEEFRQLLQFLLSKNVSINIQYYSDIMRTCDPEGLLKTNILTPLIRCLYIKSSTKRGLVIALLLSRSKIDEEKLTLTDGLQNTCLMHCVIRNDIDTLKILLGYFKVVLYRSRCRPFRINISQSDIRKAISAINSQNMSVYDLVVQPLIVGSYENIYMAAMLALNHFNMDLVNKQALLCHQSNKLSMCFQVVEQFLKDGIVDVSGITTSNSRNFKKVSSWIPPPNFEEDAKVFIANAVAEGYVKRTFVDRDVNSLCDFGTKLSLCFEVLDSSKEKETVEDRMDICEDSTNIEDGKVYYDVSLNKVDVLRGEYGENKFYNMQIIYEEIQDIHVLFTNWGRIGEDGKHQQSPFNSRHDAIEEFKKIFKSKTGNQWGEQFSKVEGKYMMVNLQVEQTDMSYLSKPITELAEIKLEFTDFHLNLSANVRKLLEVVTNIRFLEEAARRKKHNLDSMPLTSMETKTLENFIDGLVEIRALIETTNDIGDSSDTNSLDLRRERFEEIAQKSSRYYEMVPYTETYQIQAFQTVNQVNKEISRLRSLMEITSVSKIILGSKRNKEAQLNPLEYCYNCLQIEIKELEKSSVDYKMIQEYFCHSTTGMEVRNIYTLQRENEDSRDVEKKTVVLNNREEILNWASEEMKKRSQLLWHGTRTTNLMSILAHGLKIAPPEAPHSGFAFGKGIYFADCAAKSLNYCDNYFDSQMSKFLLLCDVDLGRSYETMRREYMETAITGFNSTKALGKKTPDPTQAPVYSPVSGSGMFLSETKTYPNHPHKYKWVLSSLRYCENELGGTVELAKFPPGFGDKLDSFFARLTEVEMSAQHELVLPANCMYGFSLENGRHSHLSEEELRPSKIHVQNISRERSPFEEMHNVKCDLEISIARGKISVTLKRKVSKNTPSLSYNEYVVYQENQCKLKYLVHVGPKNGFYDWGK